MLSTIYNFRSMTPERFDTLLDAQRAMDYNALPFETHRYRIFEMVGGGYGVNTIVNGEWAGFLNTVNPTD